MSTASKILNLVASCQITSYSIYNVTFCPKWLDLTYWGGKHNQRWQDVSVKFNCLVISGPKRINFHYLLWRFHLFFLNLTKKYLRWRNHLISSLDTVYNPRTLTCHCRLFKPIWGALMDIEFYMHARAPKIEGADLEFLGIVFCLSSY